MPLSLLQGKTFIYFISQRGDFTFEGGIDFSGPFLEDIWLYNMFTGAIRV